MYCGFHTSSDYPAIPAYSSMECHGKSPFPMGDVATVGFPLCLAGLPETAKHFFGPLNQGGRPGGLYNSFSDGP